MLAKQDNICDLEDRLKQVDEAENVPLFLGMSRADTNPRRQEVLAEIDRALSDYGAV